MNFRSRLRHQIQILTQFTQLAQFIRIHMATWLIRLFGDSISFLVFSYSLVSKGDRIRKRSHKLWLVTAVICMLHRYTVQPAVLSVTCSHQSNDITFYHLLAELFSLCPFFRFVFRNIIGDLGFAHLFVCWFRILIWKSTFNRTVSHLHTHHTHTTHTANNHTHTHTTILHSISHRIHSWITITQFYAATCCKQVQIKNTQMTVSHAANFMWKWKNFEKFNGEKSQNSF